MQVSKVTPYNPSGSSHDALSTFPKKAHSDIEDIGSFIEEAQALSNRVLGVVAAIIGDTPVSSSANPKSLPLGVLNQMVDRSRQVRTDIKGAGEALDHLATSFGL